MGPIRALDQYVGKDGGDQLTGGVLVEEGDRVDGFEGGGHFGSEVLRDEWARRPFQALHTGIGVQREDQHIAQRSGTFEQPDVTGMKNVVTPVGEDDGFAGALPFCACGKKFVQ